MPRIRSTTPMVILSVLGFTLFAISAAADNAANPVPMPAPMPAKIYTIILIYSSLQT